MSKKNRNIIVFIIAAVIVFFMVFANSKSALVRQLQGPIEGTDSVLTVDNKLSVISKNNYVYTWQWKDLSVWPVVAKPKSQIVIPFTGDRIVYVPLAMPAGLILADLKAEKKLADLSILYGSECKKAKISQNSRYGAVSVLFKEGEQKDWLKLGLFDSDFKNISYVFKKNTRAEDFLLYDFAIANDGNFIAGVGEKGRAWVFITDVKNENILWEKTFPEYSKFTGVEFSPDGKTLFVVEKVRYIIALDSATGRTIRVFEMPLYNTPTHQKQNICCIAVSPDGRTLAADIEPACTVWFWDIETGKKITSFRANEFTVSDIAFSPDSKYLATGCMVSPEIKIWKVPQLKP